MEALITGREILYIPIDKIGVNPNQPRKIFDQKSIEELSRSISQYGVLQPVSVRLKENLCYELVAGERRLRAARLAGLMTIPAIVVSADPRLSAVMALIENIQRKDLNYIEEAQCYVKLMEDYGYTQEMLAEKISKSQSGVANKIRILRLPEEVRQALLENGLSERHARALLRLDTTDEQLSVIKKAANGLTVSKTEELVESMLKKAPPPPQRTIKFKIKDRRIFENTIKQTVATFVKFGFNAQYTCEDIEGGVVFKVNVMY